MKKVIIVMALVSGVFASCKKEEVATPSPQEEKVMGGEKKDMGGWDVATPSAQEEKVMGGEKKDMGGWDLLPGDN